MLRTLLAERFDLKIRIESREAPIYALVRARRDGRLGPELKRSPVPCKGGARCGVGGGRGRWMLANASMDLLANALRETLTWAPTPEELGPLGERSPRACNKSVAAGF